MPPLRGRGFSGAPAAESSAVKNDSDHDGLSDLPPWMAKEVEDIRETEKKEKIAATYRSELPAWIEDVAIEELANPSEVYEAYGDVFTLDAKTISMKEEYRELFQDGVYELLSSGLTSDNIEGLEELMTLSTEIVTQLMDFSGIYAEMRDRRKAHLAKTEAGKFAALSRSLSETVERIRSVRARNASPEIEDGEIMDIPNHRSFIESDHEPSIRVWAEQIRDQASPNIWDYYSLVAMAMRQSGMDFPGLERLDRNEQLERYLLGVAEEIRTRVNIPGGAKLAPQPTSDSVARNLAYEALLGANSSFSSIMNEIYSD